MRMTLLAVAVLVAMGCTTPAPGDGADGRQGPPGPQGPRGEMGPQGPAGGSRAGLTYVDSDGREVPTDDFGHIADAEGRVWYLDPDNGTVHPRGVDLHFESGGCTGPEWISAVLPRQVMARDGGYYVRGDTTPSSERTIRSLNYGHAPNSCYPVGSNDAGAAMRVIPLPPVQRLTPPSLPYRPPLHLERR